MSNQYIELGRSLVDHRSHGTNDIIGTAPTWTSSR